MWCDKWIGTRAPADVTGPCYWFVRLVYQKDLSIALPPEGVFARPDDWSRLIQDSAHEWNRVADPQDYDVVLLSLPNQPWHMGLICGDRILHLGHGAAGVVCQRRALFDTRGYVRGIYHLKDKA